MCYKELGLILIIVILLGLMFFLEGRLPTATAATAATAATVEPDSPKQQQEQQLRQSQHQDPVPAEAKPSDHSYPFPRMMDGYLDTTMLQRPCTKDGDCISGNCGPYGYCAAQYKKLLPSSTFLTNDQLESSHSFGSWLDK